MLSSFGADAFPLVLDPSTASNKLSFKEASQEIIKFASSANLYLNETEPWKLIKDKTKRDYVAFCLYNVLESCRIVSLLIHPIVPNLSTIMLKQLRLESNLEAWESNLKWGILKQGSDMSKTEPVLSKID